MDSQHTAGIRIEGEARGAVDAHRQVIDEQKKLAEQTAKTNAVVRSGAEESKRFSERQKEQAQALAGGRHELERMTQGVVAATAAKAALVQVARGLTSVLAGGVVGALTTVALSFVSFGASAEDAGDKAEASAARTSRAWATAADAQRTQLSRVRQLQNEIATLQAQGTATDIGFGPATSISAALKGKEEELARLLANVQHGTAAGSGQISIEEATRGLRTASTELAALERRLEAIDTAYGGEISRVGVDVLMGESQRADRIAALEAEQGLMRDAARRQYNSFVKGLGGEGESSDFDRLQKQARGLLAVSGERAEAAQQLTRAQAQLASVEDAYAQGLLKNVTPAQMAQLKAIYETAAANEQAARSAEGARKAANEAAVALVKVNDQQIASREGLQRAAFDQQRTLEHEISLIGKGAGEIEVANAMRQIELELRQAIAATPEITSEQVGALREDMELRKRRVAVLLEEKRARQGDIDGQDGRIRYALDQQRSIDDQAARSAQAFEQAVATGIMLGFRRGGGNLGQQLKTLFENAIATATLTPLITRMIGPLSASVGSFFSGQSGWFNGMASSVATSGFGQRMGWSTLSEDASGNASYAPTGSFMQGASNVPGYVGMALAAAGALKDQKSRFDADETFRAYEAKLGMTGSKRAQYNPFGGWMEGEISTKQGIQAAIAPGSSLFFKGATRRSAEVGGALGGLTEYGNRWWDGDVSAGFYGYAVQQNAQEQNLMRNLGLTPDQVERVNAALPRGGYDFGMERTPWEESEAFTRIRADRMNAIAQALGRSIEELTRIMSTSAEQWQQAMRQMEEAAQASRDTLAGAVRGLPGQLGIAGLEDYQRALTTSEANAPLDRLAAARSIYESTLAQARGGDLSAVQSFAGTAQNLLGIGREVYASGGEYQGLFRDVNASLNELLDTQRGLQQDILRDVPLTIMEASRDQVAELKRGFASMVEKLAEVEAELRRWRNTG